MLGAEYIMTGIPIFLSSEIIWNMMSYLHVLRFKCVCKNWNVIIQDFQFICLHYERSPASITKKPPGTTTTDDEVEFKPLDSVGLFITGVLKLQLPCKEP